MPRPDRHYSDLAWWIEDLDPQTAINFLKIREEQAQAQLVFVQLELSAIHQHLKEREESLVRNAGEPDNPEPQPEVETPPSLTLHVFNRTQTNG